MIRDNCIFDVPRVSVFCFVALCCPAGHFCSVVIVVRVLFVAVVFQPSFCGALAMLLPLRCFKNVFLASLRALYHPFGCPRRLLVYVCLPLGTNHDRGQLVLWLGPKRERGFYTWKPRRLGFIWGRSLVALECFLDTF